MGSDGVQPEGPGPIVRSPADVLRLVVAALAVLLLGVIGWLAGRSLISFSVDLLIGFDALAAWLVDLVVASTRALTLLVLLGGVVGTIWRGGWRVVGTLALAGVLAAVMVPLVDALVGLEEGPEVVRPPGGWGVLTSEWFPSAVDIGVLAAVLAAGAPWIGRRWRRLGWAAVVGLVLLRSLTTAISFDSLQAAVTGWFAGAAALVLLGAPSRRPTAASIMAGLGRVGLALATLEPASVDARGSTPYFGTGVDGDRLFVKALGQDERSADLLFRLYRWVQRKDLGDERPFSSLRRAVEHEALVALAARDLGIRTPRLRALACAEPNSFVLAYDAVAGRSLDRVAPEELSDEVLAERRGARGGVAPAR